MQIEMVCTVTAAILTGDEVKRGVADLKRQGEERGLKFVSWKVKNRTRLTEGEKVTKETVQLSVVFTTKDDNGREVDSVKNEANDTDTPFDGDSNVE